MTEDQFDSLKFSEFFWHGQLPTEWLGPKTEFLIAPDEFTGQDYETISSETKEYIAKIAALLSDAFAVLEQVLFRHYQENIFLKVYDECEFAPRISEPAEVWTLISAPTVRIPSHAVRRKCNVGFYTMFDCSWDPEHGFAIEHNLEFQPVEVIGIDQCHY